MNPKLLILDLDETLIFSSEQRLSAPEDFRAWDFFVYKRPGLEAFLEFVSEHFKLAVWTSSSADYADAVLRQIFADVERLQFVWTRERCTWRIHPELRTGYWIKDLKKVRRRGYCLNEVLMIDDTLSKLERNYGNHIEVSPFEGDPSDCELKRLQAYLARLKDVANVRSVEKRNWRAGLLQE